MKQVVFAGGRLWGGVNTIADPGPRDGIAWFSVDPRVSASGVQATVRAKGYVAGRDKSSFVTFPSIGVNDAGKGVVAYTLMGDRYYPSAAQTGVNRGGLTTGVQITRNGFKPEDGFTCYEEEGNGPNCRWGDYRRGSRCRPARSGRPRSSSAITRGHSSPTGAHSSGPPGRDVIGAPGGPPPPGASTPAPRWLTPAGSEAVCGRASPCDRSGRPR